MKCSCVSLAALYEDQILKSSSEMLDLGFDYQQLEKKGT